MVEIFLPKTTPLSGAEGYIHYLWEDSSERIVQILLLRVLHCTSPFCSTHKFMKRYVISVHKKKNSTKIQRYEIRFVGRLKRHQVFDGKIESKTAVKFKFEPHRFIEARVPNTSRFDWRKQNLMQVCMKNIYKPCGHPLYRFLQPSRLDIQHWMLNRMRISNKFWYFSRNKLQQQWFRRHRVDRWQNFTIPYCGLR